MRVFHRTYAADAILADGFKDAEGSYLTANTYRGIWVSDVPLDENDGVFGNSYLLIELPEEVFATHEWVQQPIAGYREALIPTSVLNSYPVLQWTEAEEDAYREAEVPPFWQEWLKRNGKIELF